MIQALDCQWFSTRGHFPPRRTFINVWRHFWLSHLWGREGCYWHLSGQRPRLQRMHRTTATMEEFSGPNVSSAKVEQCWIKYFPHSSCSCDFLDYTYSFFMSFSQFFFDQIQKIIALFSYLNLRCSSGNLQVKINLMVNLL